MNRDELRWLAIRLARHIGETNTGWEVRCAECEESKVFATYDDVETDELTHAHDCPIAELEAEEAASVKLSFVGVVLTPGIADGARVTMDSGEGWSVDLRGKWETVSFDLKDGTTKTGWVRTVTTPEVKPAEFEGEH